MKTLTQIIPQELTQAIGYTILHSLWQGVLLALGLTVLLFFLNRQTASNRYRAALGALFLQLLFSGLTFGYYYQSAGTVGPDLAIAHFKGSFLLLPAFNQTTSFLSWGNFTLFFQAQLPLIVAVWLLGLSFMLLRFLGGLAYLQRLRTYKNTPLPAHWKQKLQNLSTQLNLTIPVSGAESALVKAPLVIGYFKPLILLPLGTLGDLPINQVEAILAHELAHIRRHDYIINLLQTLTEALFFYHPAIWWISDFVRVERENCCDDHAIAVCGDKLAYAQALTRLEEMKQQMPNLALAFAGKNGSLLGRIKRLFQQPAVKPTFTEGFVAVVIMVMCFTTISAAALANYAANKTVTQKERIIQVPASKAASPAILSDSTQKKKEVVMIQDATGKLVSLTINGTKVPEAELASYSKLLLTDVVGGPVSGENTHLKGLIKKIKEVNATPEGPQKDTVLPPAIEKALSNPPAPPAPPADLAPITVSGFATKPITVSGFATKITTNNKNSENAPEPLYILDVQPIDKSAMQKINPNTIKQIDVLKGDHAAKYGEAGKNGVVLITTKTGTAGADKAEPGAQSTVVVEQEVHNQSVIIRKETTNEISLTEKNTAEETSLPRDHEAKTSMVLKELKKDNLYSNDQDYTFNLTNSAMFINNVKQPDALFQKYRKYLPYPDKNVTYQTFEIKGRFREQ